MKRQMWILVVEDEPSMGEILRQGLQEQNHTVALASDGHEALAAMRYSAFDAVILDVMMPGPDGIEVTRRIRGAGSQVPILMLTARDAHTDIVKGLDAGADDYLVKPFALSVLFARLRAISRRAAQPSVTTLQVDDLQLDPASREVTRAGQRINLTATEFRLLEHLMRRPGRAASRSSIIEAVWGFNEEIEPNTVDTFIKLLRDKMDSGRERKLIQTVRGYGYILRD
jgi:DNA-binding response OmpR family regulator